MPVNPDENESNSDQIKTPSLTDTQREKLRGNRYTEGSPGTFLHEKVRSKRVERLPHRIHQLIRDVSILSEAGFFTEEYDADIWDRVETDDEKWQSWRWKPYLDEILYEPPRNTTKSTYGPRQFGIDVGLTINRISGNYLSEDEMLEILLGVLIGSQLGDQEARFADQQSQIGQVQSVIESLETKTKAWALTDSLFNRSAGDLHRKSLITYRIVAQASRDAGLSPSRYLINHILKECDLVPLNSVQPNSDQTNKTDLGAEYMNKLEEKLEPEVNRLDQLDESKSVDERKRELGNDMEIDIHQLDGIEPINKFIKELKEGTEICDIERLLKIVEQSLYQLEFLKSDVDEVLDKTYAKRKALSPDDLNKDESGDAMHDAMILAGEKEYSYIWKDYPLVEGSSSSGWETTALGDLVGAIRHQNQYEAPEVLHRYALDDETSVEQAIIENAIKEINL